MKKYEIATDIEIVKELLGVSISELAERVGIERTTLHRWMKEEVEATRINMESFYAFAFDCGIRLNKIKEQLFREECPKDNVLLFHGAKTFLGGELSIDNAKITNDFGKGFYCGESLEQSAMFVSNYPESSLYILEFVPRDLEGFRFTVDQDWMLMIAYFRGKLGEYSSHPMIRALLAKIETVDYIVAPIADNRMFEIIDSFIEGEITDSQCQHCLSATNLGNQYVFRTKKALSQIEMLCHCYLSANEKQRYITTRYEESKLSNDKVKIARKQYRGQGSYIEEILK